MEMNNYGKPPTEVKYGGTDSASMGEGQLYNKSESSGTGKRSYQTDFNSEQSLLPLSNAWCLMLSHVAMLVVNSLAGASHGPRRLGLPGYMGTKRWSAPYFLSLLTTLPGLIPGLGNPEVQVHFLDFSVILQHSSGMRKAWQDPSRNGKGSRS